MIKVFILMVLMTCVFSLSALARTETEKSNDNDSTEQIILRLESEGREATLKNDIEANDRLLAENWVNINPDGSITTKSKLMELVKAGSFKIISIENDDVMVRIYGEAAVVTGRSTSKRAGQDNEVVTRQVRFTRVYAIQNGQWRVVSAHNTLITEP